MLDIKALKLAIEQLESERRIARDKLVDAIEQAFAAAYKKEYGRKGQVVRAQIDLDSGTVTFEQVKTVVDESLVRFDEEGVPAEEGDEREHYSEEKHLLLDDARIMKGDAAIGEEIVFPLEPKDDFGRIAAQTAKQVIMQRIREAERSSIMDEFGSKEGDIVSGYIQKVDRGVVFIDFNRATGVLPPQEQIPGERYVRGARIRGYLYHVEESPRGITLRISRTHPKFIEKLFAFESPEVASGVVEIKSIAREPGSRSKIAVWTEDHNIDPVGSCVGQKGVRVSTVMNELGGEKIDIIEWSPDMEEFVRKALSPAKVLDLELNEDEHKATIEVTPDQLSLAIGKGGQNVRLAAKLTGWKIDIKGSEAELAPVQQDADLPTEGDDFVPLTALLKDDAAEDEPMHQWKLQSLKKKYQTKQKKKSKRMNLLHEITAGKNVPDIINVIVEIPKGSKNKYELDKETGLIMLDRAMHTSQDYPFDYGFMPQSHWEDGDPLDVVILTTYALAPGVLVKVRPVGIINMVDDGDSDAKIIAVPEKDPRFDDIIDLTNVNKHTIKEIEHFFLTYKKLQGKEVSINGIEGAAAAKEAILKSQTLYSEKFGK